MFHNGTRSGWSWQIGELRVMRPESAVGGRLNVAGLEQVCQAGVSWLRFLDRRQGSIPAMIGNCARVCPRPTREWIVGVRKILGHSC